MTTTTPVNSPPKRRPQISTSSRTFVHEHRICSIPTAAHLQRNSYSRKFKGADSPPAIGTLTTEGETSMRRVHHNLDPDQFPDLDLGHPNDAICEVYWQLGRVSDWLNEIDGDRKWR